MTDAGKQADAVVRGVAKAAFVAPLPVGLPGSPIAAFETGKRVAADAIIAYLKDAEVNNQGGEPEDWRPVDAEEAARLRSVIYRLLERHDASPEVLSIAGSLFDTLPVSDCIDIAEDWLSSGEIMSGEQ